ncbi:MAG: hypothetical protein U0794_11735 [Isosphaeraceae bacterium]
MTTPLSIREQLRAALDPVRRRDTDSGIFSLLSTPRYRQRGRNPGLTGVADDRVLSAYAEGFDATTRLLLEAGWTAPRVDPGSERVEVYVTDLLGVTGIRSPFTFNYHIREAPSYRSYVALVSESPEVTIETMLLRARHEAAHEAFHVFTHRSRPLDDRRYPDWSWFDEGTAVSGERALFPDSPERLRYSSTWVHFPEQSLEQKGLGVGYETSWFVDYLLQRKGGWSFLRRVWEEADPNEGPIATLDRLFRETGDAFREATIDVHDFFASDYCVNRYLTEQVDPGLFLRYGNRMTTAGFDLGPGERESVDCQLGPLACRYFSISSSAETGGFRVEIEGLDRIAATALKGYAIGVSSGSRIGPAIPLAWTGLGKSARLAADVDTDATIESHVVVVANVLSRYDRLDLPFRRLQKDEIPNWAEFRLSVQT